MVYYNHRDEIDIFKEEEKMKIDRDYFESAIWEYTGEKKFTFEKLTDKVGIYRHYTGISEVWFETDTLETIGWIDKSDVRSSLNTYYNASCTYGWDGKKKTRKEFIKNLCTRAEYITAKNLLINEYTNRK